MNGIGRRCNLLGTRLSLPVALLVSMTSAVEAQAGQLPHSNDAADHLHRLVIAADQYPLDPEPRLRLAEVIVAMYQEGVSLRETGATRLGESHASAAWRQINEALRRAPQHASTQALARSLLLARGERYPISGEEEGLRRLLAADPDDPAALVVAARERRASGDLRGAVALLERVTSDAELASVAHLELARTHSLLGDSFAAVAEYWEGLRGLSVTGRELYLHDIGMLITPDSLSVARAAAESSEGLLPWLQRFWRIRDAKSAGFLDDRLREHLRRWGFVHEHFRVALPDRRDQFARVEFLFEGLDECVASNAQFYELLAHLELALPGDLRAREPLLDHRAIVYLRHGAPERIVVGAAPVLMQTARSEMSIDQMLEQSKTPGALADALRLSMSTNESWVYWYEGGWRMLHFRGSSALGYQAPTTLSSYLPVDGEQWRQRARIFPEYAAALAARDPGLPPTCRKGIREVISSSRESADIGIRSDTDNPQLSNGWLGVTQVFGLGTGQDASGRLLISYALPAAELVADSVETGAERLTYRLRVVAVEPRTGQVIEHDTLRSVLRAELPRLRDHVTGFLELRVPAGQWHVAVRGFGASDSVRYFAQHPGIRVDAGGDLALSDIVPGRAGSRPLWGAAGEPFPLNALGAWTAGEEVEVYAELRGLGADDEARLTIAVEPNGDAPGRPIELETAIQGSGPVIVIRRSVRLEPDAAGEYQLTMRVEHNGKQIQRFRTIHIVRPAAPARRPAREVRRTLEGGPARP